jgi:hypothetical protein
MTRERCHICDAPLASEVDLRRAQGAEPGDPDFAWKGVLCWAPWGQDRRCGRGPVDWRTRALAAEVESKRWRDRCPVSTEDVTAAGLTRDHLETWMAANGWSRVTTSTTLRWLSPNKDSTYNRPSHEPWRIAKCFEIFSHEHQRPQHDLLTAIIDSLKAVPA